MRRVAALLLAPLAGLCGLGCQIPRDASPSPTAAVVGEETIRVEDVDAYIKDELFARQSRNSNPSRLYTLRADALDRLVAQRVVEREAAQRGVTPQELIEAEEEKLGPISDAEVAAFYAENREQLRGSPLEQVADRIRQRLESDRRQRVVQALVEAAKVEVRLAPPRVEVAADGPARGPADAAVTIVEFGDFQCPYCQRATPLLAQILERYPDDVRLVYRHFPLESLHPRARPSAEAAECAREQGGFWDYHDRLFGSAGKLADEDLSRYAAEAGLDVERFDACVASHRYAARVSADAAAASEIGVTGTPTFVVNGIVLYGLQPQSVFEQIIQDELDGA